MVFPMRKSRIKKEAERAIIYRMVIGIVQRFDATYRQYDRRSMFCSRRSLGSSLETYLIGAAVLIGEAEGQLFTAYKLASFLGLARGTVQRKSDHLERVKAVERVGLASPASSGAIRQSRRLPTVPTALLFPTQPKPLLPQGKKCRPRLASICWVRFVLLGREVG